MKSDPTIDTMSTDEERVAATSNWDLVRFQVEYRGLWIKQCVALSTIEELRHHAADIQQVVTWLHAHAPDRFDGRLPMGQLITGILDDWLPALLPREKLLRAWNTTWLRCSVLASGIGDALSHCHSATGVLDLLAMVPELEQASRACQAAERKFDGVSEKRRMEP